MITAKEARVLADGRAWVDLQMEDIDKTIRKACQGGMCRHGVYIKFADPNQLEMDNIRLLSRKITQEGFAVEWSRECNPKVADGVFTVLHITWR